MKVSPDGRQSYTAAEQLEKFKNRPGSMPFPVEQAAREESKSFAKRTFESGIAVDIGQIGASERGFYFGFKAGHASRDEEVKALQDEVDDWRESARKAADETCGPMDGVHCTCVAVLRHEVAALRALAEQYLKSRGLDRERPGLFDVIATEERGDETEATA